MPESQTTEPQGPSLDAATTRIDSLLSVTEDKPAKTAQPEPTPESAEESKLVEAAPEEQTPESEPPESEEVEVADDTPSQPRTFKVKVDGREIEVTEDEVLKGYSRTEDYTRKTQQLAEQRRQFEQNELAAVRAERQQYEKYLGDFETAIKAVHPAEPDWDRLRQSVSPEVFTAEWVQWQQTQKKLDGIAAEQKRLKDVQEADAEEGFKKHVSDERAKLEDKLPDMKDPEKAKPLLTALTKHAETYGFTGEDLGRVSDHRLLLMLNDAMQYHAAKAKAPKIENKIAAVLETTAPGSRGPAQRPNALKEAKERARKSGSVDDGALAIRHLLEKAG